MLKAIRVCFCGFLAISAVFLAGCEPLGGAGRPQITVTSAPRLGDAGAIEGAVRHVHPGSYGVAVYLHNAEQGGWWNVPNFIAPLTGIEGNGAWSVDPGAGVRIQRADVVAAFLVPTGREVPLLGGAGALPEELLETAAASYYLERSPGGNVRLVPFSGYLWRVAPAGPQTDLGAPRWGDSPEQVWVDQEGRLHLHIQQHAGVWQGCALTLRQPLGHGLYLWRVASPLHTLDPNSLFSLSLFPHASAAEGLDIEFSRWGNPGAENAQFVVQGGVEENRLVFTMPPVTPTLHGIDWQHAFVNFRSTTGDRFTLPAPEDLIAEFRYNQEGIPRSQEVPAQIVLSLHNNQPPTDGQPVAVVLESFAYVP